MCFLFIGSSVAYYPQREAPYYSGPNDPYSVGVNQVPNSYQEPSQRLFWSNQGSNQVGGTGIWATLTNKFPFLGSMFGRMEVSPQYGLPSQYDVSSQYGAPGNYQPQYYSGQQQYYQQAPQQFAQQVPQQAPQQFAQQYPQQFTQQFGQRFVPSARDVGITDDAVIVTPPFVPPVQPAPFPSPVPAPAPVPVPAPAPEPVQDQGYSYNRPQYRLELPHK